MKSNMEQSSSFENQKAIAQQQHPIVTNPSLFKFPGDDQLLNRIGQVERFSEEERHQFVFEMIRKAEENAMELLQSKLATLRSQQFQNQKNIYEILMALSQENQIELISGLLKPPPK